MGNSIAKTKAANAVAKRDPVEGLIVRRRALIPITQHVYENAVMLDKVVDSRLADLAMLRAQNALDRGDFNTAMKYCTDPQKRVLWEQWQTAFQRLDTPLCKCVARDERTGEMASMKEDIKGVFVEDLGKTAIFIHCKGCGKFFAVTVDESNPINYQLEGIPTPRKQRRKIDNDKGKERLLLKAAHM